MFLHKLSTVGLAIAALSSTASAQFTTTSPSGGSTAGTTVIGGIVTDLQGFNGSHVMSQIAASSLYIGYAGTNPQGIGSRSGYTPGLMASLGGGLSEAAFRFTLYDGDMAPGNFDFNNNFLQVNGFGFSSNNWSAVQTVQTTSTGTVISGPSAGFSDSQLHTGWFYTTDAVFLNSLYTSLSSSGTLSFALSDTDPYDNYYDFRQGIDGSLIDQEQGPITTTPEPASMVLLASGLLGIAGVVRRKRKA